jgi:two-component system, OmpR family, KDP operon response regulator KdpE
MTEGQPLILIIDDEPQIRRFLRSSLGAQGYRTAESENGRDGLHLTASLLPDLVLLDLGLPDMDGIEVVKQVRGWSRVPIIVLTARGMDRDKVLALDNGADDYVTKPFSVPELAARLRVALRHAAQSESAENDPVFRVGELRIDRARREVSVASERIHLTPLEYKLLVFLSRHAGRVCTHRQILEEVWGLRNTSQTHYLRIYMRQIRNKIEKLPARPRYLLTELGVGYRLAED